MELLIAHQQRQSQFSPWREGLFTACRAFHVAYEAQHQQLIELKCQAHYWEVQFKHIKSREQELQQANEELQAKLRKREQQLFGRRSEKHSQSSEASGDTAAAKKKKRGHQVGKPGSGRRDYSHLPAVIETHELSQDDQHCQHCGLSFNELSGTEDSEVIEIINVRAYRRQIKRKKYQRTCQCQQTPKFIDAPKAPKLLPKGKLGVSVWAHLLLQKYEYQQPVHRVLNQLSAHQLSLATGTVIEGFRKLLALLLPVYDLMVARSLSAKHWHADETGWKVFEKLEGKANHRWFMWLFRNDETVVYKICPSRSSQVLIDHFGSDHTGGTLNVDRYSAYKAIAKAGLFILAFCWAHVRRDFLSHAKSYPHQEVWALAWVERIAKLYHINNQRIQCQVGSKKFYKHNKKLKATIAQLRNTLDEQRQDKKLLPSAQKVLTSLDNHWEGLTIFVERPEIPMDNNKAENGLRPNVIGRKNYYGSGSIWSSALTAAMSTIFGTLKLAGLNRHTWLLAYFEACAMHDGKPPDHIEKFLPWNMTKKQKTAFCKAPLYEDSS